MNFKRIVSTFATLFALILLTAATSQAAATVAGRVINGTNNDRPLPGVTLQLVRPAIDSGDTAIITTVKTDAAGRFSITSPNIKNDDLLTIRIDWQGFVYEIPAFDGAGKLNGMGFDPIKSNALELTVFDSTTVAPPLIMTVHHVALSFDDRDLKCIERLVIENPSARTYIGSGPNHVTVDMNLPVGAENVELDPAIKMAKLVKTPTGYGVTLPITPAKYDNRNAIIIHYTMPWKRGGIDLSRRLNYPTRFFFLVREVKDRDKLHIVAPQLGRDENQQIPIDDQPQLRIVNGKGFPQGPPVFNPGDTVSINVSRPANALVWAFVAFVVALSLVVPLAFVRVRGSAGTTNSKLTYNSSEPSLEPSVIDPHRKATVPPQAGENRFGTSFAVPSLSPALRECVSNMARLDEEWDKGTIARLDYQAQRDAWRNKALEIVSDDGGVAGKE